MKHLALFLPSLAGGGAERIMLELAESFAARDVRVSVVLARAVGEFLPRVKPPLQLVDLGAGGVMGALHPLARFLDRARPDALLSTMTHANLVALWARMMSGVDCRVVLREAAPLSPTLAMGDSAQLQMIGVLVSMFFAQADAVVAVAQGAADDLIENFSVPARKVHQIYNPVDVEKLLAQAARPLEHPWLGDPEHPVVLGAGRLSYEKGFDLLIEAFAHLPPENKARLLILGEGAERAALEARVEELGLQQRVSLPGFVDNPFGFMQRADAFVLSSRFEGCPNALLEAMALGLPSVATLCPGGAREILLEGEIGPLVPMEDPIALAAGIAEVLRAPIASARLQKRIEDFRPDRVVDRYAELLDLR